MTQLHTNKCSMLTIKKSHLSRTGLLGHLTLYETSGQAAIIKWYIRMDNDPTSYTLTKLMLNAHNQKSPLSRTGLLGHLTCIR